MKKITILLFMLFCFCSVSFAADNFYEVNDIQSSEITDHQEIYSVSSFPAIHPGEVIDLFPLIEYMLPEGTLSDDLKWSSNNVNVVRVNQKGQATGLKPGTATIYAKTIDTNFVISAKLTVLNYVSVTDVKLDKTDITVNIGDIVPLTPTVLPENATNKAVEWRSDNTKVVKVNSKGEFKAYKAGTATVYVRTIDGKKVASCKVTVNKNIPVTGVKLDKTSVTVNIGDIVPLTATVLPENATNKNVEWKSSDTSIVKVNSKGEFKAYKAGKATVYVRTIDGKKVASCKVTVNKNIPVTGVKLDKTSVTVNIGDIVPLTATVLPSNATNKKVEWKSSDTSIVKVNSKGEFKAYKAGTATVYVRTVDGKFIASCKVTVQKNVPVTGVKLNKTSVTANVGDIIALTATVLPSNATNKKVEWKSSNTNIVKVNAKGEFKTYKEGTATVSVRTVDGKFTASCKITVKTLPIGDVKVTVTAPTEKYNSAYNLKYSAAKHLIAVKVSLPAGMADTKLNYVWTLDRENGTVIANSDSVYSDAEFIYRPNDTSSIPADVTAGTERIYNRGFKIKSSFVGRYIFLSVKTSSGAVCNTVKFYVDEPAAPPTPTGR